MIKNIIMSCHESGQNIYWRRKFKDTEPPIGVGSSQAAGFEAFEYADDEARRVRRFLDKNCQIDAEIVELDSDVTAACIRGDIDYILHNVPAMISVPVEEGMVYPLDYEIEGVYAGSIRDGELEALAVKNNDGEPISFDVVPAVELPQVEPGSFFEQGSKTDQVWQLLKPYVKERKVEFVIGGQTLARPILTDEDGNPLVGIAECLHADALNLNVQTYAVRFNQEVSDRDRAYILLADVASLAKLPTKVLAKIMLILFDDLKPKTGKRRGDDSPMTPDEEMSERTGLSPHKTERASTLARKMEGVSQDKNLGSIPENKAEQISARVDKVARLIQRILERFDREETELFVRNRMRSELEQRLSVLCKNLKPSRSKK